MALLNSLIAFGTETVDVAGIMETTMNSAKGELLGILAIAVPIVGGVTAVVVAAKFGLKWLRSIGRA